MLDDESMVRRVANLGQGESYTQARFIPAIHVTPAGIRTAKRELSQLFGPVVARARKLSFGVYRVYTIHSHTRDYDVVVAAVIVREPEAESATPRLTMAEIMERCGCGKSSCNGIRAPDGCYVSALLTEHSETF